MFRKAYSIASGFTLPVVLSRKTLKGKCSSSIGTYIVVNEDGWIVTAGHILEQIDALSAEHDEAIRIESEREAIKNDQSINAKTRYIRLRNLKKLNPKHTHRFSSWWGNGNVQLVDAGHIKSVDIGVGRLEPFDRSRIRQYPVFKDPSRDFEEGTSLCKLGFPFHSITPTWNAVTEMFELPAGAVPLPRFPIEGIFTRTMEVPVSGGPAPSYPLRLLETSSPGLRGQSGGPIFDVEGSIWAVQCRTAHYPLGFSPSAPGGSKTHKEHQFLNVGLGTHVETILGLFKERGITCQVSSY